MGRSNFVYSRVCFFRKQALLPCARMLPQRETLMTHSFQPQWTLALATLALAGFSAVPAALAAPPSAMHGKKMAAQTVYICKDCHAYYSPATAKRLNYKDDMGHTLVKAAKAPTGYMDAGKMKM